MSTAAETTTQAEVRLEHGAKRVRVYLGGEPVADTANPVLVWEGPKYPTYYFPAADVRTEFLEPAGAADGPDGLGVARAFDVRVGERVAAGAARRYEDAPIEKLRDLYRFDWHAMDAWFEEDEEVFTHARDPYTRVDVLHSSRHVRVELDGVTVAETTSPRLLFETGLPVRYYVPKTDVRMGLLVETESNSHCPYKGHATEYWSVALGDAVHEDIAWSYPAPFHEVLKIAGMVAFYNHRVDIYVDGVHQ